jgi:hypothetical protein
VSPNPHIRRSARLALALPAALLSGFWAESARGEAAEASAAQSLTIESSTCSHALVDEVQRFTHIELKNASLPSGESAPRVILSCSDRVSLIRALVNGHESSRQLDLARTDAALTARVIALAIAELVRDTARGEAVELPPPPLVPSPAPPDEVEPTEPPSERFTSHAASHLVAFAKLENFSSTFQPLSGGGLSFSHEIGHFSLGLGPSLATGQRSPALGTVNVLAADLSLRLAYRFQNRALPGEIGIGHAFGLAKMTGSSPSPNTKASSVSGPWAGPFVFGTLDVSLAEPLFLEVAAQFGVVTVPVHGLVAQDANIDIAGVWSGVSLGLGVNL